MERLDAGIDRNKVTETPIQKLEKKFGQSPVFVASTLLEDGGTLKNASPASLLKEAIHVISCGYEDKTEWGKEVKQTLKFLLELFCQIRSKLHINCFQWHRLDGFMVR